MQKLNKNDKLIGWIKADTQIYLKKPKGGKYLRLLLDLTPKGFKYENTSKS